MKTKRIASLLSIAKEAGVSVSTVSRALNNNKSISSNVRERVKAVADKQYYVPNSVAVNLKMGRTKTIGVIVPMIGRSFFAKAIEGIEDCAYEVGYNVIISQSKNIGDIEEKILISLMGRVDGVIVSPSSENKSHNYFNNLANVGIPLVFFDRMYDDVEASVVKVDDCEGAIIAISHLIESGRKKIFHLAGPSNVSVWRERLQGYRLAMSSAGIEIEDDWVDFCDDTNMSEGAKYAQKLIDNNNIPDAVLFAGDYAALGAMKIFQENGIRVPEDVAIVGFANEVMCSIVSPTISSVDQYSNNMGKEACRILLESIEGGGHQKITLQPTLIVRESSNKSE